MNLLLWSPKGAGQHYGGPGMSAYRLYDQPAANRLRITLVHGCRTQGSYQTFAESVYISVDASRGESGQRQPIRLLLFLYRAARWLMRHHHEFDCAHFLGVGLNCLFPALLAHWLGVPAVIKVPATNLGIAPTHGPPHLASSLRRHVLRRVPAVIAISGEIAAELRAAGVRHDRIFRIPNGVNTVKYRPGRRVHDAAPIRIAYVGGINRRKRPHLILGALKVLSAKGMAVSATIAGPDNDPDYAAWFWDSVEQSDVVHLVDRVGFLTDPFPVYSSASLFCLPSENEGLSNALLEAMACGLPPIVTRFSGLEGLVESGYNGAIVEPHETQIAEAIAHYSDHPELLSQHAERCREIVVRHFSSESILQAHLDLFDRICRR